MTTKLLPRLIATGALAAGLSIGSAATGLATAHASTPTGGTPIVTAGPNGSLDVHLTYDQVTYAAAEMSQASKLCQTQIVPAADAISVGQLHLPTCTTFTQRFSMNLANQHQPIVISYLASGQVTARVAS